MTESPEEIEAGCTGSSRFNGVEARVPVEARWDLVPWDREGCSSDRFQVYVTYEGHRDRGGSVRPLAIVVFGTVPKQLYR